MSTRHNIKFYCFFAYVDKRLLLTPVCLLWLGAFAIRAAEHYVRPAGTCTNTTLQAPYTSWNTAATQIQWAVDAATFTETVYVTNGAYCVTSQITITNNILLRSVNGWTNTLVYADWPTYTTRVFYVVNTGVLDGFTISNGHWFGNSALGGGGAYVASSATVQNCYFTYNFCSNTTAVGGGGGAYVATGTIQSCYFVTNIAIEGEGGGGAWIGPQSVVNDSFFIRNHCGIYGVLYRVGGGLVLKGKTSAASIQLNNSSIISNSHSFQAGGLYAENCTISNCLIAFNVAGSSAGGAMQIGLADMIDCVISNNTGGSLEGAGIYTVNNQRWVNCFIVNNRSVNANGTGGATLSGGSMANCTIAGNYGGKVGGINLENGYYPGLLESCKISNNISTSAANGAGGVKIYKDGYMRNCLIMNNTNMGTAPNAGGVYMAGSGATCSKDYRLSLINCTIANNYSPNDAGGLFVTGTTNYILNNIVYSNRTFSGLYTDVYSTAENEASFSNNCSETTLAAGQGNITSNPRFKGDGSWRLRSDSPAINAGINQDWMTNAVDLDGRNRLRYGIVDMGAYEAIYEGSIYKVW